MSDEEDAVDPEDARPEGHYPRFRSNTWHYVPDELAQTISLGPAGDGEPGQDWVLSYTPERRDPDDREKVFVRLTPRALHELYIETALTEDSETAVSIQKIAGGAVQHVEGLCSSRPSLVSHRYG